MHFPFNSFTATFLVNTSGTLPCAVLLCGCHITATLAVLDGHHQCWVSIMWPTMMQLWQHTTHLHSTQWADMGGRLGRSFNHSSSTQSHTVPALLSLWKCVYTIYALLVIGLGCELVTSKWWSAEWSATLLLSALVAVQSTPANSPTVTRTTS